MDILSRINHKNFVTLLGYCEENEPFMRMLAFEYTPNGTLYEHLHCKYIRDGELIFLEESILQSIDGDKLLRS